MFLGVIGVSSLAVLLRFCLPNVIQGVLGSLLIRMNTEIAIHRRQSVIGDWPILEVVCASAVTAALSYLVSGVELLVFEPSC